MLLAMNRRMRGMQGHFAAAVAVVLAIGPELAEAQNAAPPPTTETAPAQPAAQAEQPQADRFTSEELRKLLAPIALYPDALLAQMLPASAYPLEVVQAERWLEKNPNLVAANDFSGIDSQKWDPAVKAMARFPDVLRKMSQDLPWTTDLGDAIVNQPQDVAATIQQLRAEAEKSGALQSNAQQTVRRVGSGAPPQGGGNVVAPQGEGNYIAIEPTDPTMLYVPTYDSAAVWGGYPVAGPLLTWGAGIALGALATGAWWNWGTGAFYPGWGGAYGGYAGWGAGRINNGNINVGNDINIGNGNRQWSPNGNYRPGQGSKPGIGNRPGGPGRPGGVGGPGRPGGVGGVGRPGGVGGPGGIGGAGRPGGIGGSGNRPGNRPGTGNRPGAGNRPNAGRPGGRPSGARPANRPATRPSNVGRPGGKPGNYGGMRAGGHPGMRPGGYGGGRPGGYGGGMHRGGMHRGGMHRGGGGHRRAGGGGRGGGRRSDIRLKHDIVLLGRLDDGLGYYRFVYNGGHTAFVGVMAQEVQTLEPGAVKRDADGYLRVSYDVIGVPFETYAHWLATGSHLPSVKPVAR
jgi:Protein of unknown function (DUF3300)